MERQSTSKLFRIAIAIVAFFVLCTSSLLFASCGTTTASTGCEHEFDFSKPNETIQATCGRPGSAVYTCAKCGESVSVVIQLATGNHKTENGVCTECGQTVADTGLTQAQFEAKVSEIQATLSGLATKSIESTVGGVKDAVDALKEQLTNGLKSLSTEVAAGGKVDESKISSAIESAVENSLKELGNLVKPGDLSQVEQNIEDYIKNHVESVLSTLDGGVDGLETALTSCLQTQYFNDQLTILQTTLLDTIKSYIETEVGKVQTTLTNTLGTTSLPEVKDTIDKVLEALVGPEAPAAAPGATTEPNSITGYLKSLWTALYGTGAADAGNGLIEEVKSVSGDIANLQRDVMAVLGDKADSATDETIFGYLNDIYAKLNEGCVAHTWMTTPVTGQEDLDPCLDAVKCNYVCAVCGAHLQKEGVDVEVTMYPTGHVLDWNHAATEAADEDTDHYQHATCITPAHAEAWCVVCKKYTGEWTYQGKPTGQHHYVLENEHIGGNCEIEQTLVYHCATCGGAYVLEGVGGGSGVDLNGKHNYYVKLDENENLTKEALTTEDPQYAAAVEEYKKDHGITGDKDRGLTTKELYDALRKHLNVVSESPATCTEPGLIVVECAYCGMRYAYSWGEPLGHHFSKSLRPEDKDTATCTQNGVKDYYYCPQCGYYFDNTTGVPTYLTDEDGQKIYGEAADKDVSNWKDGIHSIEAKEDAIKAKALEAASTLATGHKFDKYVTLEDATCENGERYALVCSVCGEAITDGATAESAKTDDPKDCDLTKAWEAVKGDLAKASEWLVAHGYFNTADAAHKVVVPDVYTDDDVPVLDPAKVAAYIEKLGIKEAKDLEKYYTGTNVIGTSSVELAQPVTGHTFTSVLVIEQYTCEVDGCYILVCTECGAEIYEEDADQDHDDLKGLNVVKYKEGKAAREDAESSDLEQRWEAATEKKDKIQFLKDYGYFNIYKTVAADGAESWDEDAIAEIGETDLVNWFTKTGETYHDGDNNLGCEKLLAKDYGHLYKNGAAIPGDKVNTDKKNPRVSCLLDTELDKQFTEAKSAGTVKEDKLNADFKAAQEKYGITDYCTRNHCPLKDEDEPAGRYTGGYAAARDHEMGYFMYKADGKDGKSGNRTETVLTDYIFNNNPESVYTDSTYVCPNTGKTYATYKEDPFNLKNISEKWAEANSNGSGGLVSPLLRENTIDFDNPDIKVQALSGTVTMVDGKQVVDYGEGAPTCWFTYRCRWYTGNEAKDAHLKGGCDKAGAEQPTHVAPGANDDPYYWANCQHGSHCTVCGALQSPRTRHIPVIVTAESVQELLHTLVAGEKEGGKTVEDVLKESLGAIYTPYAETGWSLAETCEKDGYVFWFCMGELELIRDGKTVRWNEVKDVELEEGKMQPSEGNYKVQVLEKHPHGSLTEPETKAGWITVCYDYETQTPKDASTVTKSCIEGYYFVDYCRECAEKQEGYVENGELPQDIVWVMEGPEGAQQKVYYKVNLNGIRIEENLPGDLEHQTNSDGMYQVHAPGKHQVAPVKGYTSIEGYEPATETSPARLTVECTVCGTRMWINWDKESAERANVEFIADKLAEHTTDKFYADVQPLEGVDNKIEVKKDEVTTKVPEILENSLKGDGKGAHVVLPEGEETITVENSKVMPKAGQEVVIELNGNTLALGTDFDQAQGEITLKDGSVTVPDDLDNFGAYGADAKLTLENVTVTGGDIATLSVGDGATLTVNESTIVSKESTAFMTNAQHDPVTINLTKSTFISATTDIGVVINAGGKVTAEECKFVGGASGVWVRGNGAKVDAKPLDVTFTNCEFYTRLEGEWHTNQNWEGGTHMPDDIGAGIVIGDGKTNSEYGDVESVKLNGCKFGIVKMNTDDTNTWTTDESKHWGDNKGQQPVVLALNRNNTINVTFDEATWTNLKTGEAEYVFNTDTNLYLEDGSTIAQATVKHGETVVQLNTITLTGEKEAVQTKAKSKIEELAKQGGNITLPDLEGDPATVTLDGKTKIEEDTTIDLNGNTLKGELDVKDGAHLTVKGGTYEGKLYALAADDGEGSRVTLEGVTTKAEGEGQFGLSIAPTAENGSSVATEIVVNITDSRIEGDIGLVVNGRMDGAIINIKNSAILGNNGCGLSVLGKATVVATDSVFFGSATAVQMGSGKGTFTDCTFVSAKDNFGVTEFGENTNIPTATLGNFVINSRGGGYDYPVDVTLAGANTKFITAKMHSGYAVSNVFAKSETGEQKTLLTWGTEEKEIGYYEVEAEASEKVTITVVEATPTAASAERVKLTITGITGLSFKVATNVFVYTNNSTDGSASVELAAVQAMVKGVAISAKDA